MLPLKKFQKHINGCCFVIMTGYKPLVSLFVELSKFRLRHRPVYNSGRSLCVGTYKIRYKAYRSHYGNADSLGRLPLPVTVKEEPDERVLLIEELDSSPMGTAQISHCTDRDPALAHVRECLMRGWPGGKIDMNMAPNHCRRVKCERRICLVWCQRGDSTKMSTRGVACISRNQQNEKSRTQLCLVAMQPWTESWKK